MEAGEFRKGAIRFLIKFFVIYAVLQALILLAPLEGMEAWIASLEAGMLQLRVQGSTIYFNGHAFEIVANCTGLLSGAKR